MSDEEQGVPRNKLLWAVAEHSNIDVDRLRTLTNTVNEGTARALYRKCLDALASDSISDDIDRVVTELERAVLEDVGPIEASNTTGTHVLHCRGYMHS
jgi:hypothetical protein